MEEGEWDEGVDREGEDLLGEAWKRLPGAGMGARSGGAHGCCQLKVETWLSLGRSLVDEKSLGKNPKTCSMVITCG